MRYAYWRKPDTTLHKKDDGKHEPTVLLAEIGNCSGLNAEGQVFWRGMSIDHLEIALHSTICIQQPDNKELNEYDTQSLVHTALVEIIKAEGAGKPISPRKLLQVVNSNAATLFRRQAKGWTVVTALSIRNFREFPIDVFGNEILDASRENFPYPEELLERSSYVTQHIEQSKYQVVAISALEITAQQAFDKCMTAVNVLRGIWNLIATYRCYSDSWSSVPKRRWIGKVHLSPIHTVHDADANLISGIYMYEPDYTEDVDLFVPKKGWAQLDGHRKTLLARIQCSPLKNELIALLDRYAAVLDQPNLDVAFLMLWGLLEKMTNTVGGNYDETIKRASRPYSDRTIVKQLLNQMRLRRNQFVHAAGSTEHRDKLCYITKNYVDMHLMALIRNDFSVNSLDEYGEFLSLPTCEKRLRQLRDSHNRALELRNTQNDRGVGFDGEGI